MLNQILKDSYQIQQELGRQTGRRTFLAEDLETQQKVVIKLLLLGEDFDWQDLKLFEREAETLKTLTHPNIPRYLDYFELDNDDEKGFGLVQTYVEGKTLEQHLKSGRTFSETEVKELAISLLEILSYLHQHEPPVIHRDIKPSNILLTNRSGNSAGQVYLVDFGSVQTVAATNGGTITVVGTYGYMPPEQFGGRCVEASDLYSLGATLIFLITGLHPTELPQKDLQIQFRQTANFSEEFADWLEWMTEPSLSQRYKSTQEAIKALENPVLRTRDITLSQQKPKKPLLSEIKLYKDIDDLEIVIPPKGIGVPHIALISFLAPLGIGWYFSGFGSPSILIQIISILFILCTACFALFKRTKLKINRNRISVVYELFGFDWQFYSHKFKNDKYKVEFLYSNLVEVGAKPELFISIGSKDINLHKYGDFNSEELGWLAQEISDYLEIPIKRF
ncbi:MAG: serine/threonine-protein kinase [Cyanobacteria bacterium J06629_18]